LLSKTYDLSTYLCYIVGNMDTIFTVVSSKGQIVIPVALRDKLGIEAGTRIAILQEADHLVLQPITASYIDSLLGCCQGEDSLVEAREHDHRVEKR
jgi:AbrB family looped-hinge helix DNA binding protein